jgi:hypothetical protein
MTLGTNDAFAQIFETNNTERMRIDSNGQIAIGTTTLGNLVNISSSTLNISGLRLSISSSTTANGETSNKVLSVNTNGDVRNVIVPGTENIIDFSVNANPNTGGTVFTPNQQNDSDVIYASIIDNSLWKWNGSAYVTYSPSGNFWSILGNAGTNPASRFVGTTDNQALAFRTNNTEWMRLTTDGTLALRTQTPNVIPGFNTNALEFWDSNGAHSDFTQRVAGGGWGISMTAYMSMNQGLIRWSSISVVFICTSESSSWDDFSHTSLFSSV